MWITQTRMRVVIHWTHPEEVKVLVAQTKVEVAQSSLTLCNPMEVIPPSSSVQADSPGQNTGVGSCYFLHHVQLFMTPWTASHELQTPLSMKFSKWVYWSGLPCLLQTHLDMYPNTNFKIFNYFLLIMDNRPRVFQHRIANDRKLPELGHFLVVLWT